MSTVAWDWKTLERQLVAQGWSVETTSGGHRKFTPPDKAFPPVFCSGTPGDVRSVRNALREFKRSGFVPPRGGAA